MNRSTCKRAALRRVVGFLVVVAAVAIVGGCGNPLNLVGLVDGPDGTALSVSPGSGTVVANRQVELVASGGFPPYAFELVSGVGTLTDSTYQAPASAGSATLHVSDGVGNRIEIVFTVDASGVPLGISPSSQTVYQDDSLTFSAVGGTGPYSFSFASAGDDQSGATLDGVTGDYTAGPNGGTDTVTLTDASNGATVTATVTVVEATIVEDVNYVADPITNIVGSAYTGGAFTADGTIQNLGSAAGSTTVTWTAYASPDTNVGGPTDVAVDTGSFAGLASTATEAITIAGNWPSVQDTYYLLLEVRAADEIPGADNVRESGAQTYVTTPVAISPTSFTLYAGQQLQFSAEGEGSGFAWDIPTNVSGGSINASGLYTAGGTPGTDQVRVTDTFDSTVALASVTVQATPLPDAVNYVIDSITVTSGGTTTGDPLTGTVDIRNDTTGTGSQSISWDLYASKNDTVLGGGDELIASSTTGALAPSGTVSVAFSDFWPDSAGDYYLIATISAADETNTTGNLLHTATATTITSPPPADVDYEVSVAPGGGSVTAGGTISESFSIVNSGGEAGTSGVTWDVYLSQDQVYGTGDVLVDSGSLAALGSLDSFGPVAISGTWPAPGDPWPYYLIVRIGASDDVDPVNNARASAVYNKVVADELDYAVTDITSAYPVELAGAPIRESFTVTNIGATSGGAGDTFDWVAYASADAVLDAGEVVDTGTSEPYLVAGASATISINGLWPTTPGPYDLYVQIAPPGTDPDSANDLRSEGPFTIEGTPDYTVDLSGIAPTGEGMPGNALNLAGTFTFTITNAAAYDGREPLVWRAYASTDSSLDAADHLLASDTMSPLLASGTSTPIDLGAETWPAFGALYWIIVTVSADDDEQTVNNVATGPAIAVPWTYVEGAEANDDLGSPPAVPNLNTYSGPSPDPGGTLEPGELYKVIGYGEDDGSPNPPTSDAYQLSVESTVNTLQIRATWSISGDYIDFIVESETVLAPIFSLGTDLFREPDGGGFFVVSGWGADTFVYVTIDFLTDMPSTEEYSLYILAQP
ncbi:MAG: hypothetical protein ACOC1U_00150 [Spirochaetota bacterium]